MKHPVQLNLCFNFCFKIVEEEGNKNEKGEGKYNILRSVKRKKDGLPSRILNLILLQFFE